MRDVVYVALTLGFFALAGMFVVACARIVGPDDASLGYDGHGDDVESPDCGIDPVAGSR